MGDSSGMELFEKLLEVVAEPVPAVSLSPPAWSPAATPSDRGEGQTAAL